MLAFLFAFAAHRSDNFIVGLPRHHPTQVLPVHDNYRRCGQYAGAVPAGATVSLQCEGEGWQLNADYVTVQFPTTDHMNFREMDVCANGQSTAASI